MPMPSLKIEVDDGRAPTREELLDAALDTYGHFTAMQVRGGWTRGLDLHLARLDAANRELFGEELAGERVRSLIRHALTGESPDASVRVIVRAAAAGSASHTGSAVRVFVTVRAPFTMPHDASQRLKSARYLRTAPHIKRPGDFGQTYHIAQAQKAGYDDALLVADDGTIAEAAIANIAFFDGSNVIWPDAPVLPGITMQLIAPRLAEHGIPSRTARVTLPDVGDFVGACVTNSRGVTAVTGIDEIKIPIAADFIKTMNAAYDAVPWDEI
jgi:branched-subunit amino acid aminotransferase/4-amino-4-deoxychorismate lyase